MKLETLPTARFHKNHEEVDYLEYAFSKVAEWIAVDDALVREAIEISVRYDIVNLDALHIAAVIRAGVDEFVTTEKPGKPLHRVTEISVVHRLDL